MLYSKSGYVAARKAITSFCINSLFSTSNVLALFLPATKATVPAVLIAARLLPLLNVMICLYGPGSIGELSISSSAFCAALLIVANASCRLRPSKPNGVPGCVSLPFVVTNRLTCEPPLLSTYNFVAACKSSSP